MLNGSAMSNPVYLSISRAANPGLVSRVKSELKSLDVSFVEYGEPGADDILKKGTGLILVIPPFIRDDYNSPNCEMCHIPVGKGIYENTFGRFYRVYVVDTQKNYRKATNVNEVDADDWKYKYASIRALYKADIDLNYLVKTYGHASVQVSQRNSVTSHTSFDLILNNKVKKVHLRRRLVCM